MFKIFPGTRTHDGRKVPIAEMQDWKEKASSDPAVHAEWTRLYGHKMQMWLIKTGADNGLLVLDVDVKHDENGFETLNAKGVQLPVTLYQTTPSGGKHFFFRYPQDGRVYGNKIKFEPGLDIRGEGGYAAYYGFDSNPIAEAPPWLLEAALKVEKPVVRPEDVAKVSFSVIQEIVATACENIRNAEAGNSNNVLNAEAFKVGQFLPSGSVDQEYAFNELFKAAKDRGKHDYEARATILSGFKGGAESPFTSPFGNGAPQLLIPDTQVEIIKDRWTPPFFSRFDLTNFSKLRKPQLFKDWSTEDITLTTADGGTGKTTLKLLEAICLALGEPFLGFECLGEGRTLFITGEDTYEKLGAMIGAIQKQMGLMNGTPENEAKVQKVLNNVLVKKDSDLCLISKTRDGFIRPNQDALNKVFEAVDDLKPRMIVFDPISSFWGSESALNDMSKAVTTFMGKIVERTGACVEMINHVGKDSSSKNDMTQFAGRGGTGLPSHSRVCRALRPVGEEEFEELTGMDLGDRKAILCNVNKFTDGSPLYNKPFLIVRDGYLFSRITLVEQKMKQEQEKISDTERIFNYVQGEKDVDRYPSKAIIIAHFAQGQERIPKERVARALDFLSYTGFEGNKLKLIDNPDPDSAHAKVFTIVDPNGKEITKLGK